MMFRLVERSVGCTARQVRWKAKSITWGDDMKARKTHRLALVAEQMSRLQKEAKLEVMAEAEEASALEMLHKVVPLKSKAAVEPAPVGEDDADMPSDVETLDQKPIEHYVVIKKTRERSKYSIIQTDEIVMTYSKLPRVTKFCPYVQIREPSGKGIIGYGLWKPSKKLVYVLLWTRAARHKWSPHSKVNHDLAGMSVGRKFWFHRFFKALEYRQTVTDFNTTECFTLINGDADGCPGLVVNLYSNSAAITVTDHVALAYLAYLVEYLKTRTPTTVIHVAASSRRITLPNELSGYIPRAPPSTTRVVSESDMLLGVTLEDRQRLLAPSKLSFREAVGRYAAERRVAVLGDTTGSCLPYAVKGGCRKALGCSENELERDIARKNIARNFLSGDTTEVAVTSAKGVAHHFPDLEKRVSVVDKKVLTFATDVEPDVYDCVVADLHGDNPEFMQHQWVELVLTKLVNKTTVKKKQGGVVIFISNFDQNETQNILRNVAEHTNLDIRLVEPIFPAANSVKSILTNTRQAFSGWVVNVRSF